MRKSVLFFLILGILLFFYSIITINPGPGLIFIILLRIIIPFTIFKWPLWGTIISLIVDGLDVVIADFLGSLNIISKVPEGVYDRGDKILDMFYLSMAFVTSLGWKEKIAKNASKVLFVY